MHGNMNELGKTIVDVFKIKTSIMSSQIKKKMYCLPNVARKATPSTTSPPPATFLALQIPFLLMEATVYTLYTYCRNVSFCYKQLSRRKKWF